MNKQDAKKRIDELNKLTSYYAKKYYDDDEPEISDFEYDMLMVELRNLEKEYPDAFRETLVVLDGTTGQNALAQAKQFSEVADISGIILTKMDGTAKGGIAVAIQSELGIPVKYIGVGETIDDLQKFDSQQFVNALFSKGDETAE